MRVLSNTCMMGTRVEPHVTAGAHEHAHGSGCGDGTVQHDAHVD